MLFFLLSLVFSKLWVGIKWVNRVNTPDWSSNRVYNYCAKVLCIISPSSLLYLSGAPFKLSIELKQIELILIIESSKGSTVWI